MQPKSTQSILWSFFRKVIAIVLIFVSVTQASYSQTNLFNEGFATVLPAGWAEQNLSSSIGTVPTWEQGVSGLFPSHSGGPNDYILGNYNNLGTTGTIISNWLFCPSVILTNGDVFSFWTRTVDAPAFPDRLQVWLSTNGASVNVGTTDVSTGDFTTLLLDINPTYDLAGYPNTWTLQTITISGLAAPIQGRVAFRYFVEDGGPLGNNSDNVGIDDVIYFQSVTAACTGTPNLGNTLATATSVCPGTPVSLSAQNAIGGSGITYQWESSPTLAGPYLPITGAQSNSYSTTITADTYFQLTASCNGGTPGISTPILVTLTPPSGCYCTVQDFCDFDDVITNVQFGGIDNTTDCSATGYTDYTTTVPAANVISGAANPISVTVGPGGTEFVTAWIDYDHSGTFDASEYTVVGSANGAVINGSIAIPASAQLGITRMRLRVRYNGATASGNACVDNVFGETEDYAVNITPCIAGSFTSSPVDASSVCGQSASFSASAIGSLLTYQWQQRASATALWTNVTNGTGVSGATSNTLNLSGLLESMSGSQYRVLISGGCTATDFSGIATLTVGPLVINVDPADYSTCSPIPSGAPVQLTITTQNGVTSTTTLSFPSGTLNTAIPDADNAGIINAVNVTGIPAGATILGASVKLNIVDDWVGDLCIAMKAPNDNVLNLDYGLTQTGGAGPTTGFANTVISSAGTATLISGTDPYTGIFAPDAPTAPGTVPTACTNLSPVNANVFTFPDLYSTPNGTWTLGILDYGGNGNGTLTDWELTLTYTFSVTVPYTGVWSPAAGLFTDAAGTIAYTGTEETTVYAAPSATTLYTVTVTDANCPPAPVVVPVRILAPDPAISITAAPYDLLYPGLVTTLTAKITPDPSAAATFQWYFDGQSIAGATDKTYQANVDGIIRDFTFELTDPAICSGKVSATITLHDSVTSNLFIYPNPNSGIFQVRYDDGVNDLLQKPRVLSIYDSKGSRVFSRTYSVSLPYQRMDVDISTQPKGVYIVELSDVTGRRLGSERVIVH